jgi:hypothetical protein
MVWSLEKRKIGRYNKKFYQKGNNYCLIYCIFAPHTVWSMGMDKYGESTGANSASVYIRRVSRNAAFGNIKM